MPGAEKDYLLVDKVIKQRQLLPKKKIIKNSAEIREVLQEGTRLSGKTVNIFLKTSDEDKFAVLVPKRIGHAVKRNRMKRIAREIYRKNQHWFSGKKVIFFIKRFTDSYSWLENEIGQLVNQE